SLFAGHAERDAGTRRLLTRCALCSLQSLRNLCGGLLASHTLEKADIIFRPQSPDWRLLASRNGLSHVRSCLALPAIPTAFCMNYKRLQLLRTVADTSQETRIALVWWLQHAINPREFVKGQIAGEAEDPVRRQRFVAQRVEARESQWLDVALPATEDGVVNSEAG